MKDLIGRVAIVTGAGAGLGEALARRLVREGAQLALVDRDAEAIERLAKALPRTSAHPMDVTRRDAWPELLERVRHLHGGLDLLVNNAGLTIVGAFEEQSSDEIDRIVDVNLRGVLHGCHAAIPLLRERRGHIVNVSSLAGQAPFPYQTTYCATKYAVRGFSAALRIELRQAGVGVSCVMPGTIATRFLDRAASHDAVASTKLAELMLARGMPPGAVAERIVTAVRRDEGEVLIGMDARVTVLAHRLAPRAVSRGLGAAFAWRTREKR